MSSTWIIVGAFLAFIAVRFVIAKRQAGQARGLIEQGAVVIDVRTAGEFASGHLPNAKNIPLHELSGRLREVEKSVGGKKDHPIVVYCRSGARSGQARTVLGQAGFSGVVNGGGFSTLAS